MPSPRVCTRIVAVVCTLVANGVVARAQAPLNPTTRVSVASDGVQANGDSGAGGISADGRFVAFASSASNLVTGDTNNASDVFVHDRQTGATTRVSVASDGTQANGGSGGGGISADGRFVAFVSDASNLVAGDTNNASDIFVHDRQTRATTRVSLASDGTQSSAASVGPAISADGRYVAFAFTSAASCCDPFAPFVPAHNDVFVHDRQTGATTPVRGVGWSDFAAISANGRYVAFTSGAICTFYISEGFLCSTEDPDNVFVHDRETGATTRVSVASDGSRGNSHSRFPAISADGRFVAFTSYADNLVPGDTNGRPDIFAHDQATGLTTRIGVTVERWDEPPAIGADGRFVVFVDGDQDGMFVHDRETGVTTQVDVATDGTPRNGNSWSPAISTDGRFIAFTSYADNLVPGDTNASPDIFVHDLPPASEVPHAALLFRPTPGSTLTSSSVRFEWTSGTGVSRYALYVGTEGPGSYNIHASQLTSPSAIVSGLPTTSTCTVYVRLWSYLAGGWQYDDYTYQTEVTFRRPFLFVSPWSESTATALISSSATFEWYNYTPVSEFVLYVGTEGPGSYDIYCASQGTRLSTSVSRLPTDGRTVYVRLWYFIDGAWLYDDYTYQAVTGRARLQAPVPGSALSSSTVTFGWTDGGELSQIALYVGTGGAGSFDLYAAYQGTSLSATVLGVPTDGRVIYVRLWSCLGGVWQYEDSTYRASTGERLGARLTTPSPGATFDSSTVTFEWTRDAGVSQVALYVGRGGVGSYDLYAGYQGTALSATVSYLPYTGGPIYVRLWSCIGGEWQYEDYIYRATTGRARLTTPAPRSTLTSSSVTFGWTVSGTVDRVALYVGTGGFGSSDVYVAHWETPDTGGPTAATVSGLPTNGQTIYVRLWSDYGQGWDTGTTRTPRSSDGRSRTRCGYRTPRERRRHAARRSYRW